MLSKIVVGCWLLVGSLTVLNVSQLHSQEVFTLSGKVLNEEGTGLEGANAVIAELKKGATTDVDGGFQIENLPEGKYMLSVSYLGFETWRQEISISKSIENQPLIIRLQPAPLEFEELLVRATRAADRMPFTYSNLKKEALESGNLGQDVPYLLQNTPSVVVSSDAGAGIGYTGIRIRGSDPTRINVTINGIPLNDAESHNVFWVDLPDFVSSTRDVQIQRGVGASTNGSGAFGASIHLNTNELHSEPYFETNGTVGSFGTLKGNLLFGTGLLKDKFSFDGRLSRIVSDGYIDRASVDLTSYAFSAAMTGKKHALRAHLFSGKEVTYQAWSGVPVTFADDKKLRTFNVSGMERSGAPHDNEVDDYTQTHLQLLYNQQLAAAHNLNFALHYTRGRGFFEQYKTEQDPAFYNLPTDTPALTDLIRRRWLDNHYFGTTFSLSREWQRWQTILGGALHQYLGDHFGQVVWAGILPQPPQNLHYYEGTGDKSDANVFMKMNYSATAAFSMFLDLQYRFVRHQISGTDNDFRQFSTDATFHFFNPKTGVFYDISEKNQTYASFAIAHREPNRDDFSSGKNPTPERLYNTEIGFRRTGERTNLGINFYHMHYRDQLVLTGAIDDVGAPVRVNVPSSYRLGVELVSSVEPLQGLRFEGNASLSRNKISSFTEFIDDWDSGEQAAIQHQKTDLSFSPAVVAGGEISYKFPFGKSRQDAMIALSGKYVGRQFLDNTSNRQTSLDPYFFSDLRLAWAWRPAWATELGVTLSVQNLFSTLYSANGWTYRFRSDSYDPRPDNPFAQLESSGFYNLNGLFPQATRHFLLGVKVRW